MHCFPVVVMPSPAVKDGDYVALRVQDDQFVVAAHGQIVCLRIS